jgi:hypothetical protein
MANALRDHGVTSQTTGNQDDSGGKCWRNAKRLDFFVGPIYSEAWGPDELPEKTEKARLRMIGKYRSGGTGGPKLQPTFTTTDATPPWPLDHRPLCRTKGGQVSSLSLATSNHLIKFAICFNIPRCISLLCLDVYRGVSSDLRYILKVNRFLSYS